MNSLAELAKKSVEEFVKDGEVTEFTGPLSPEMCKKAGVFVCIKKEGQLRGCIGTYMPCCDNIAEETRRNAIAAATQDPRFEPVGVEELSLLSYSVDVLSPPERITRLEELDHKVYGVIVTSGRKRGLLLPDLEGVDSVEDQLRIARTKAGIAPGEEVEIFRFRIKRFT